MSKKSAIFSGHFGAFVKRCVPKCPPFSVNRVQLKRCFVRASVDYKLESVSLTTVKDSTAYRNS